MFSSSKQMMDPLTNGDTDDETTIALKRKRARRVSFADNEITSIHIFKRDDDDSETPPGSKPADHRESPLNQVPNFFSHLGGDGEEEDFKDSTPSQSGRNEGERNEDEDEDDDDGVLDGRKSFLRPIGSPSPGSSTVGSVTSTDDEDNFFGPVSSSFIRPGQLSDSAASDENHDVTMDSTVFSLHFRSIAKSDASDLKTPTKVGFAFDEKSPVRDSSSTAGGSVMSFVEAKKQPSPSSVALGVTGDGRVSSEMSIVGENSQKYDYGRLSPTLQALLREGSKDLFTAASPIHSGSNSLKGTRCTLDQSGNDYIGPKNTADSEMGNMKIHNMSVEQVSSDPACFCVANQTSITNIDNQNRELKEDAIELDQRHLNLTAVNTVTPRKVAGKNSQLDVSSNYEPGHHYSSQGHTKDGSVESRRHFPDTDSKFHQLFGSPMQGSVSSLSASMKQRHLNFLDSAGDVVTPSSRIQGSFLFEENENHGRSVSLVRKSISKLIVSELSPCGSSVRQGNERLKQRLSKYSLNVSLFEGNNCEERCVNSASTGLKEQQSSSSFLETNGYQNFIDMNMHVVDFHKKANTSDKKENGMNLKIDGEYLSSLPSDITYKDKLGMAMKEVASPSCSNQLGREVMLHSRAQRKDGNGNDKTASGRPDIFVSSPLCGLDLISSKPIEHGSNFSGELKLQDWPTEITGVGKGSATLVKTASDECNSERVACNLVSSLSERKENSSLCFGTKHAADLVQSPAIPNLVQSPARKEPTLNTSKEELMRSPVREKSTSDLSVQEPLSEMQNHDMHVSVDNIVLSPKCNQNGVISNKLQVYQSPSYNELSSGKKRKSVAALGDESIIKERTAPWRSPEVHISREHSDVDKERKKLIDDKIENNWADVMGKFTGDIVQPLSQSIAKLNLRAIGVLEDGLVCCLRVRKFKILCSQIQSQKMTDPLKSSRHTRVAEAKSLLYCILYERAKLQLLHLKHERLLKGVQLLNSVAEEAQVLKLNYTSCTCEYGPTNNQTMNDIFLSSRVNCKGKDEVSCDKLTTMRKELEALNAKSESLSKFLHNYLKLMGDPTIADCVKLAHDYVKKKMYCRFIRQDLKWWDVDDFEYKDGCYNVLLNYNGYLNQSLKVKAGPCSSLIITSKWNSMDIGKTYPNMDACTAFEFAIKSNTTKKPIDARCLVQETQISSVLLCNLLNVVDEVQQAMLDIRNLTQAKFHSASDQYLDLRLSFIDFCSGRKVKVTLDLTCLKSGVYPSDILPSDICELSGMPQVFQPQSLVALIRTAAESSKIGYSRILRLCRCISKAIQNPTAIGC